MISSILFLKGLPEKFPRVCSILPLTSASHDAFGGCRDGGEPQQNDGLDHHVCVEFLNFLKILTINKRRISTLFLIPKTSTK